jgi:hypothetical protein
MKNRTCPSCSRTVKEINLNEDVGTCLFCDINAEGSA